MLIPPPCPREFPHCQLTHRWFSPCRSSRLGTWRHPERRSRPQTHSAPGPSRDYWFPTLMGPILLPLPEGAPTAAVAGWLGVVEDIDDALDGYSISRSRIPV